MNAQLPVIFNTSLQILPTQLVRPIDFYIQFKTTNEPGKKRQQETEKIE